MATLKGKTVYLYLAIACFLGLMAILVFDGYIGVYDTIILTSGERVETVAPDYWLRQSTPLPGEAQIAYYTTANQDDTLSFSYTIDNRAFSPYATISLFPSGRCARRYRTCWLSRLMSPLLPAARWTGL